MFHIDAENVILKCGGACVALKNARTVDQKKQRAAYEWGKMNVEQLKIALIREGIRTDAYQLDCGLPSETYVLCCEGNKWSYYYSERGEKSGYRVFDTEEDACNFFFDTIIKDPTAHVIN